jgi:hypothetical protein
VKIKNLKKIFDFHDDQIEEGIKVHNKHHSTQYTLPGDHVK